MVMTSKERILRTIHFESTDYVPLAISCFNALAMRTANAEEYLTRQLELGIDVVVHLPLLLSERHHQVEVEVWLDEHEPTPRIHKVYKTPKGTLEAIADAPNLPPSEHSLLDQYLTSHAKKNFVCDEADLGPLEYLFAEPGADAIAISREQCAAMKQFAADHNLATIGFGGDPGISDLWHLAGPEQVATWGLTQPEFLREALRIITRQQSILREVVLEARPDIIAGGGQMVTPLISPRLFEEFVSPILREQVQISHSAGIVFRYTGTVNMMPFLDILKKLHVDLLYGIDPIEGNWDLAKVKAVCDKHISLWGGINGYLHLCHGTPEGVERAVTSALEIFSPGGGFILTPVDDICLFGTGQDTEENWQKTWRNVLHMVDVWKRLR